MDETALTTRVARPRDAALLSSSEVMEARPQAWHRKVGFEEIGILAGVNPAGVGEVFFKRDLRT